MKKERDLMLLKALIVRPNSLTFRLNPFTLPPSPFIVPL